MCVSAHVQLALTLGLVTGIHFIEAYLLNPVRTLPPHPAALTLFQSEVALGIDCLCANSCVMIK